MKKRFLTLLLTIVMVMTMIPVTALTAFAVESYSVTVDSAIENGTVSPNLLGGSENTIITLTVTPDDGFELDTLTVTDADGNPVPVTDNTFKMPASNVTVTATFKATASAPAIQPEITDIIISDFDGNDVVEVDTQNKKYIVTIPADASNTEVTVTVKGNNLDKITTENENNYYVKFVKVTAFTLWADYLQPSGEMQVSFFVHLYHVGTSTVAYSTDGGRTYTETGWTVEVKQAVAVAEPEITDIIISDFDGNDVVEVDTQNKKYIVTIPEGASSTLVTVTVKGNNLDKIVTDYEDMYKVSFTSGISYGLGSSDLQPTGDMQWGSCVYSDVVGIHAVKYSTDDGVTWTETGWTVEVKQAVAVAEPEITDIIISDRDGNDVVEVDTQNKKYIVTIPEGASSALVTVTVKGNNLDKIETDYEDMYWVSFTSGVCDGLFSSDLQPTGDIQWGTYVYSNKVGTHAVEYSTDGGVTWTETGWTVEVKQGTTTTTPEYATKAELDAAVAELGEKLATKASVEEITTSLNTVISTLNALDDTYVTHDELDEALVSINDAITKLNQETIPEMQEEVSANASAIEALNTTVSNLATTVAGLPTTAVTDALRTNLNDLSTDLAALAARVTTNEGNIATLQTQVSDLEAAVEELKAADTDLGTKIQDVISEIDTLKQTLESTYATKEELKAAEDALKAADEALTAAVEQLTKDLEAANEKITANEGNIATNADDIATNANDIAENAKNIADLVGKMTEAQDAIAALQTNYATKQELTDAIDGLKSTLEASIATLQTQVGNIETALTEAKENISDNAEAIEALKTAMTAAEAAIEALQTSTAATQTQLDALENAFNEAKTALEAADKTLQDNIDTVKGELDQAIKDFNDAIKAGNDALSQRISAISGSLSAARKALEQADADNKAELVAMIEAAEAALDAAVKVVQKNLDDAKAELNRALAEGDKANADALAQAITDLNAAIDGAEAAAEAADADLTAKIDSAEAALEKAIEALAAELDSTKAELMEKDGKLQTFIIIVCVVSGVAFCGCGALALWILDTRRKLTK